MPWLSDEIPGWDDMTDEEREAIRDVVRSLGLSFALDEADDDCFE